MYPELFSLKTPAFLRNLFGFLPEELSFQAYGALIGVGMVAAFLYARREAGWMGWDKSKMVDLFLWIFVAAFIGGRFFVFFEDPAYYFGDPANMLKFSGSGFVFYGSLIFSIPTMIFLFKKYKIPVLQGIDTMAVAGLIVHMFGRMGCFMAGCCHGLPTEAFLGVTFTHPDSAAEPLGTPLHPTQLYSVFMLLIIFATLRVVKLKKQFDGQLFLLYIIMYAAGRSVIEEFRGDEVRGFVFDGFLSHSQLISLIVGVIAIYYYRKLFRKSELKRKIALRSKKKALS